MARASSKIVKSIPNTETGSKVTCFTEPNESGDKYVITQNPLKMQFTLWKCIEDEDNSGGFEKIKVSDSPLDLYELIPFVEI